MGTTPEHCAALPSPALPYADWQGRHPCIRWHAPSRETPLHARTARNAEAEVSRCRHRSPDTLNFSFSANELSAPNTTQTRAAPSVRLSLVVALPDFPVLADTVDGTAVVDAVMNFPLLLHGNGANAPGIVPPSFCVSPNHRGRNVVVHCSTRDQLMGPCPYSKIIAFDIRRAISRISDATRAMITRASLVGRICRPATEFLTINRICHRAHSRLSCARREKVPLLSTS